MEANYTFCTYTYELKNRQCTHSRYTEARSRNQCCRGKVTNIFGVGVYSATYPAWQALANYIFILGISDSTLFFFFHIIL